MRRSLGDLQWMLLGMTCYAAHDVCVECLVAMVTLGVLRCFLKGDL